MKTCHYYYSALVRDNNCRVGITCGVLNICEKDRHKNIADFISTELEKNGYMLCELKTLQFLNEVED